MDNKEKKLIGLLLLLLLLPFLTTLLLDWQWVQAQPVRQILIYAFIALQVFVFGKNIYSVANAK